MAGQPQILTSIQAARGIAALAVVLCHAGTVLGDPFGGVLRVGHAGVDFFFVLSGFVIATAHRNDLGRPSLVSSYARKRLVRIFPIYWGATTIALCLWWLGIIPLSNLRPGGIVMSLLLLPQHIEPTLGVAWTLQHEMLFYVAFAILILHRGIGIGVFAVWACFAALQLFSAPSELPWAPTELLTGFVGSSYNLQFGLGIAVALPWRYRPPFPQVLAAAGAAGLLLTAAAEHASQIVYLGQAGQALFGMSSALVILGLAAAERHGNLRAGRFLVFIGSASYAIYLIHVPVLIGLCSATGLKLMPPWISVIVLAMAGTGAGVALHMAIERPMLHVLRSLAYDIGRLQVSSAGGSRSGARGAGIAAPSSPMSLK
ncbi:MAG TPA: acyltransferase [Acetobacteraceae bacterium]|jgi:peptidoglycan/LPS O-acetylase OafA/YrhL